MSINAFYNNSYRRFHGSVPTDFSAIATAYAGRAYHNLEHLEEMLMHYDVALQNSSVTASLSWSSPPKTFAGATEERENASRRGALFGLALVYHDLVYVAGRKDNERRSADALIATLRGKATPEEIAYADRLVMATKHHVPSHPGAYDEAFLIDLDLAVLARDREGYLRYATGVRQEFRRFPDFLYRPGRRRALRELLAGEYIYRTAFFRQRYEAAARENLGYEVGTL